MSKSDNDPWRDKLSPEQYQVCRQKGTERPFTGEYLDNKHAGQYRCVCCGNTLFDANTKFNSGTGWPSFWDAVDPDKVKLIADHAHGMSRIEVTCAQCGAHLGHVFDDGPAPTGKRYCINSVSLEFKPKDQQG